MNFLGCLPKIQPKATAVTLAGIRFPNRIGVAAGLDKNGDYIKPLSKLGFGFIEIGSVTPKAQAGNLKPRLFRLVKNQSLINRMGFNNNGLDYVVKTVKRQKFSGVLGINIGKNKETPNDQAVNDYLLGLDAVYAHASYIVINISSPNTPELRDLQYGNYLSELLAALKSRQSKLKQKHKRAVPLFIKIAPDLTQQAVFEICHAIQYYELDGIVVSNTTLSRDGLVTEDSIDEQGGLSGQGLKKIANQTLVWVRQSLPKPFPVIAVGGIMDSQDAMHKCELGADLVQLYSGLIYAGPVLVQQCNDAIEKFFTRS